MVLETSERDKSLALSLTVRDPERTAPDRDRRITNLGLLLVTAIIDWSERGPRAYGGQGGGGSGGGSRGTLSLSPERFSSRRVALSFAGAEDGGRAEWTYRQFETMMISEYEKKDKKHTSTNRRRRHAFHVSVSSKFSCKIRCQVGKLW